MVTIGQKNTDRPPMIVEEKPKRGRVLAEGREKEDWGSVAIW